ncbi:MAG: TetR/AcrR family transcriptional regulator [Bacteroidota bacterium]
MKINTNTEEIILEAARTVFMQKGFAATRMCDIAYTANINPAMLHYYFRKKEKLFSVIFEQESLKFHSDMLAILHADMPFGEKIRLMIKREIEKIAAAPYLPMFILSEIQSNPESADKYLGISKRYQELFKTFCSLVESAQQSGQIRAVCPRQLFLSIQGLTLFPFLAKPMIKTALDVDDNNFLEIMRERVDHVCELILGPLQF